MNVFLSGGGSPDQSAALDSVFFGLLQTQSSILYIPVALRGKRSFGECGRWFDTLLSKYGNFEYSLLDNLSKNIDELMEHQAVFIGGGNTYELLSEINDNKFGEFLVCFAKSGRPIYGGSAGAVVLGEHISTVRHMDTNECGIRSTSGVNLLDGYSVWPHYKPALDSQILRYVEETSNAVYAISEESGIHAKNTGFDVIGTVWKFDAGGKKRL